MNILQQVSFFISSFLLTISPTTQFVEGVTGQPVSFLPSHAKSQTDQTVSGLIYRGLFKYDNFGNLVPDLAESWAESDDGLVYTVTIKPDQYWSDGSRITADDIIYTSFKLDDLQYVGTDKVDDQTVRFILPNKLSSFLNLLTIGIMKDKSEEDYSPLLPVSSGDFTVIRVERSGPIVKDVILRNNKPDHPIKKMIFRYYSNDDELVTAAKLGEIDGFMTEKNVELENFKNHRFPIQGVYFALFFNLDKDSVKDAALRDKLQKVINKEQLIYSRGILVEGPISRNILTNHELDFNPYDPKLAEDLDIDLTLTIPDIEAHREVAESLRQIWREKLGVDLHVIALEPDTFVQNVIVPRDYEILLFGQETSRDPGRYANWHSTQKEAPGLNLSNFEHVRADRALEEGRNALDPDDIVVHYNEFQKVIVEQIPAIFLYHPFKNYYVSRFIEGIGEKYTFTVQDRYLDFANWRYLKTN